MTKAAVLPNGEMMHFPDETPDAHIHAQVRSKMGLPPPDRPMDPAMAASLALKGTQEAAQQQAASTLALHQQIDGMMRTLLAIADQMRQMVAQSATTADSLASRFDESTEKIAAAVTAPKKAVKGADGTWKTEMA